MNKFTKVLSSALAVMMAACSVSALSFTSAGAAEENKITVTSNVTDPVSYSYNNNSTQFTVTYALQSDYKVINVQSFVNYDSSVLKLASTTTNASISPVFSKKNYVGNIDLENMIKFNSTSTSLYNFTQGATFFTATFDIVGSGSTYVDLDIEVLTGTTATMPSQLTTAKDVPFVSHNGSIDSSKFTMTASGSVKTPATDGVTLRLAAPTSTTNRYNWTAPTFFYGDSTTMSSNTSIEMTATDKVYYTADTGSNTLISGGNGWTVYEVVLDKATVAAVDAAKYAGFASTSVNRTTLTSTGNVLKAGVDEYGAYASAKASVSSLADKTFVIRDSEWGATSAISYKGYWVSNYNTIKFAAPVAPTANSNWNAVEFYYANGGTFDNAAKLEMVNTLDTTKITDLGNMTTLKTGNWYIFAVSVDPTTAAKINASTNAGFAKPGASNKTAFSKNVLKAYTNNYVGEYGTYGSTARTLDELEGQVFVVQSRASASSLLSFNGEWQTVDVYTDGNDDTITIKFAAPKGSKASNEWSTGVELYYGDTTNYKNTTRIPMTATSETLAVNVDNSKLTSVVSGNWVVYSVELTLDQIKAIDNSKAVGFIKADSYNRTSTNFYRSITRASKLEGITTYSGVSESIETFDGYTFVINDKYTANYETTTYLGSWVA